MGCAAAIMWDVQDASRTRDSHRHGRRKRRLTKALLGHTVTFVSLVIILRFKKRAKGLVVSEGTSRQPFVLSKKPTRRISAIYSIGAGMTQGSTMTAANCG